MENILKKFMEKEVILYLVFGITTTIINLAAFFIMDSILKWNENVANMIAVVIAVLVAYITNKDLVFHSEARSAKEKILEFIKFIIGRAFTMFVEFFGGLILFKLPIPNIIIKFFITIVVVILNFFISKFFAFKKKSVKGKKR